jgi:hypothetical protein
MFFNCPKAATGRNAGYSRRLASGWPSRLVATAAEDRLSFPAHIMSFAASAAEQSHL